MDCSVLAVVLLVPHIETTCWWWVRESWVRESAYWRLLVFCVFLHCLMLSLSLLLNSLMCSEQSCLLSVFNIGWWYAVWTRIDRFDNYLLCLSCSSQHVASRNATGTQHTDFCFTICWKFCADYYALYVHPLFQSWLSQWGKNLWQLLILLFMMKVMVWYFMSSNHNVYDCAFPWFSWIWLLTVIFKVLLWSIFIGDIYIS
jgi:hypothetical protein